LINNMTKKYTEIRCKANIVKCTINDLRRSAITNWAHLLPIQVVQTLAGHADIITLWMIDTILTPMGIFEDSNKRISKHKCLLVLKLTNEADETRTHNLRIDRPNSRLVSPYGKTINDSIKKSYEIDRRTTKD